MSKADEIRDKIASMKGGEFTTRDLPSHANLYSTLMRMEKNNEIRFVRHGQTGGRPCKVYVEEKLKTERKNASKKLKAKETPMPSWCTVWPEFFAVPAFVTGKVTNVNGWSECHE